jgi:hypothetical protein
VYIRTLLGSHLHHLNIELYQRHHPLAHDRCAACGHPHPCQTARHASLVIREAGEDPRWYDGELPTGEVPIVQAPNPRLAAPQRLPARPPNRQPVNPNAAVLTIATPVAAAVYAGFAVGNNTRRASITYAVYER